MTDDSCSDSDLFETLLYRPPLIPVPVAPKAREDWEDFSRKLGLRDPDALEVFDVVSELGRRIRARKAEEKGGES
ncbi:MAG: hypothetical protein ACYDBP_04285 [Leptospirales bacterium]